MEDFCLKRFFDEEYNNKMYYEYLFKKAFVDYNRYLSWLNILDYRNKIFADIMQEEGFIDKNDLVIESCASRDYSVSNFLNNEISLRFEKEFNKPLPIVISKSEKPHNFCYVCNGYYSDTIARINQVLDRGSFVVGTASLKHNKNYKEIVKFYNELKRYLQKEKGHFETYNISVNSDYKVYMLTYNAKTKG